MHEDMRPLLNAYLDGELHGIRMLQVQTHLAACAACRNEVKELRRVSDLLRAAPLPQMRPVERFVANLTLSLPRRTLRDRPPKPGSLLWWAVPAALLGAWFFIRTTFAIVDAVSVAGATGLLGQVNGWLNGGGQQSVWYAALNWLGGGQASGAGESTLGLLNTVNVIGGDLFSGFLWQAAIVMLYWGWLAAWWLRRRPRPMKLTARPARS
jgi:hypothetical protein